MGARKRRCDRECTHSQTAPQEPGDIAPQTMPRVLRQCRVLKASTRVQSPTVERIDASLRFSSPIEQSDHGSLKVLETMAGETYSTAAKDGGEEDVVRMENASLGRVVPIARPIEEGGNGGRGGA